MATAKRLPSGNYSVLAYIETIDGERKYKRFTASTKKQAEYDAALYKVRKKRKSSGLTVGEAVDRYIQSKTAVLSPKTIKEYQSIRKRVFLPLMRVKVDQLTDEQIQSAVSEYSLGRSPKTVRNAVALLSSSLRMFKADFKPSVSLPQPVRKEMSIPDDDAVKRLIQASAEPLTTALMLSAVLGLRRSEICALTWDDVDMKKKTIRVSKALVLNQDREWVIKTTKTTSSYRTLEMPGFLAEHMKTIPHDGSRIVPVTPDGITFRFISLRDKLGLSVRLHDLRHYYASTLLEMGVPDLYAMKRMGHATTNMLKAVYQHLKDTKEKEINQSIDDKMTGLFG